MDENTADNVPETLVVPATFTVITLKNFYDVIFPYFIEVKQVSGVFNKKSWQARELFEKTLWDRNNTKCQWLVSLWESAKENTPPAEFVSRFTDSDPTPVIQNPEQVLPFLFQELGYQPPLTFDITKGELRTLLTPFFDFVTAHIADDELFEQKIIWEVITRGYPLVQAVFWEWLENLPQSAATPFVLADALKVAVELSALDTQHEPITQVEYEECMAHLDHPSKIVAAVAAQRLGVTYIYESVLPSWAMPLPDMLEYIYKKQTQGACVAGGFLGNLIDGEGLGILASRADLVDAQFDVRAWALRVIIDSPNYEPYVHPVQSFWFYIHEFFDYDAEAVLKMIAGERYWIAMMCITESIDYGSLDVMRPALRRLILEAPADIVSEVKELLICKKIELDSVMDQTLHDQ